jgi:hypothetical protein
MFRIATEINDSKLICHNYGHGGAGWTFLFGCVNESIRQFQAGFQENASFKSKSITVIGAGCYGLLTAIELVRLGHQVSIVAKDVETTSHNAVGFFFPRPRRVSTPAEIALFEKLALESYQTYLDILHGQHPFINQGPKLLPAYYGMDIDPGFKPLIDCGLIKAPVVTNIAFNEFRKYIVNRYQTVFIDAQSLMQELQIEVQRLGIRITKAEINSFDEIFTPIIFNCTGLGAKQLTEDPRMLPVQGHLIMLQQQPIDQLQYLLNVRVLSKDLNGNPRDELIYFAPKQQGVLGITFLRGQADPAANVHEFARIIERCQQFFGY